MLRFLTVLVCLAQLFLYIAAYAQQNDHNYQNELLKARESYSLKKYDDALRIYSGAAAISTDVNKAECYINRMAIAVLKEDRKLLESAYKDAEIYFGIKKEYYSKEIEYYLKSIKQVLDQEKLDTTKVAGFYSMFVADEGLKNLLSKKKYQEAFMLLNRDGIEKNRDSYHATIYDTLNVLLHKKDKKRLICEKEYQQYPDAYAYNIIICGILTDYLATSQIDNKKIARLKSYIDEVSPSKIIFYDLLKEIK